MLKKKKTDKKQLFLINMLKGSFRVTMFFLPVSVQITL